MGIRFSRGTSITRFISSMNALQAKQERENLILQSTSMEKELPMQYDLESVSFDADTRITNITIRSQKTYRTIDRYVTQNYVRYPVYSEWKTKTSFINKKIKLTNAALENLNLHEDDLIQQFAVQIILAINNESIIPSWLLRQIIQNDYEEAYKNLIAQISEVHKKYDEQQIQSENTIMALDKEIKRISKIENRQLKAANRTAQKINKISTQRPNIFLIIISFGIYGLMFTKSRKHRLMVRLKEQQTQLNCTQTQIKNKKDCIKSTKTNLQLAKDQMDKSIAELKTKIIEADEQKNTQLREVKKLDTYISYKDFTALSEFCGLEYEKIIGCYIIHNRENNRYYVGQSKDVMKRIKQHFHGTIPNNIIFAEDYYKSQFPDKTNLFEVKVIPLKTKDELDRTEMKLIEEYEANTTGYNSTKGNS